MKPDDRKHLIKLIYGLYLFIYSEKFIPLYFSNDITTNVMYSILIKFLNFKL